MNTLVLLASLMAVAAAAPGLASYYPGAYATPYATAYAGQHFGPPGSDTLEVTLAKQAHFAAHAEANARNHHVASPYIAAAYPHQYAAAHPVIASYHGAALPVAYGTTRLVDPIAIAKGAPLPTGDTVEVAAAKVAHFQAHAAEQAIHSYGRYKRGLIAAPLAYAHGSHAVAYNAPLVSAPHPVAHYAAPHAYAVAAPHAYAHSAYSTHIAHPVAYHSGAYAHHY